MKVLKAKKGRPEQTSEPIASIAGRILNAGTLNGFETWLEEIALQDTSADDRDKKNAMEGIILLRDVRRLAASALTQRG